MAETESIFVKILTPEKPFLVKEVSSIEVSALDGPYLVLPRRAPAMKLLTQGVIVLTEEGKTERYLITDGVVKIRDNGCTILVKEALNAEDTKLDEIKKRLAVFEEKEKNGNALEAPEMTKKAFLQTVVGYFEKRAVP